MAYDLRSEPWIPYRRRRGRVEWGAPTLLTDALDDDPVVAFAAPRADFDGALHEFLIGLLTAALLPNDEDAWHARWRMPPTPAELRDALNALPAAFDLDGLGPRVFQDLSAVDLAENEPTPIGQLLIEAPGEQTTKLNKDLFNKRGGVERLSRPAAAMALAAMQTYAPSGGQGHRTSLRGGGPLTTLVDPRVAASGAGMQPLWEKLWANVETQEQLTQYAANDAAFSPELAFPWLALTRASKGDVGTTLAHAHPLQAYFGLPRRIRLEFGGAGWCDLTGVEDERTATAFRMRNYGVQYVAWQHPLTPHYQNKTEWLPMHGQPGGVGWRDWLSFTFDDPTAGRRPARAVAHFLARRAALVGRREVGVHAFGYDMDNMKARGWVDATLPAFALPSAEARGRLAALAKRLTEATSIAGTALLSAVQRALFAGEDAPKDEKLGVRDELWDATASAFYARLRAVADASDASAADPPPDGATAVEVACREFRAELERIACLVFDRRCPAAGLTPEAMRRLVGARFSLVMTLHGQSKLGRTLWEALGLPAPGAAAADAPNKAPPAARPPAAKRGKAAKTSSPTSA